MVNSIKFAGLSALLYIGPFGKRSSNSPRPLYTFFIALQLLRGGVAERGELRVSAHIEKLSANVVISDRHTTFFWGTTEGPYWESLKKFCVALFLLYFLWLLVRKPLAVPITSCLTLVDDEVLLAAGHLSNCHPNSWTRPPLSKGTEEIDAERLPACPCNPLRRWEEHAPAHVTH